MYRSCQTALGHTRSLHANWLNLLHLSVNEPGTMTGRHRSRAQQQVSTSLDAQRLELCQSDQMRSAQHAVGVEPVFNCICQQASVHQMAAARMSLQSGHRSA